MIKLILTCLILCVFGEAFPQQPKLILPLGHSKDIHDAVYFKDGKHFLTSSYDGKIKMWQTEGAVLIKTIQAGQGEVEQLELSPDERKILGVCDGFAIVWNLDSNKQTVSLFAQTKIINAHFGHVDNYLVTVQNDLSCGIWDMKERKSVLELTNDSSDAISTSSGDIVNAEMTADGKNLLVTREKELTIVEIATGAYQHYRIFDNQTLSSAGIKFSKYIPGEELVIFVAYGGEPENDYIQLLNLRDPATQKIITGSGSMYSGYDPSRNYAKSLRQENFLVIPAENGLSANIISTGYPDKKIPLRGRHKGAILSFAFSSDKKKLITNSKYEIYVWNVADGSPLGNLRTDDAVEFADFIPGTNLLAINYGDLFRIFSLESRNFLGDVKNESTSVIEIIRPAEYDAIPQWPFALRTGLDDYEYKYFYPGFGDLNHYIKQDVYKIDPLSKLYNDSLTYEIDDTIVHIYSKQGFLEKKLISSIEFYNPVDILFSPDNRYIALSNWSESGNYFQYWSAGLWEVKTGQQIISFGSRQTLYRQDVNFQYDSLHTQLVTHLQFSPDSKFIATCSEDGTVKVWDTQKRQIALNINTSSETTHAMLYNNNRYLIYSNTAGENAIVDMNSKKELLSFYLIDSINHLIRLPEGYYMGTQGAVMKTHFVTDKLEVINFDQFDVRYNRPDKVLERVGSPDTALIRAYRNAYLKRIQKLGVDTTQYTRSDVAPTMNIVNREEIRYEQKNSTIILSLKAEALKTPLDHFNVWINDVPVFGLKGISLKNRNAYSFDTSLQVVLSEKTNRVEASVTNTAGLESYRTPLFVNYNPLVAQKSRVWFIGIGIDRFANSKYDLDYSSKDIRDLSAALRKKFGDALVVDTLFNEKVELNNIKALREKLLGTSVNDKVIIAYSGHGLLNKNYDYFLSSYSIDFDNPDNAGIPYEVMEKMVDGIPARKKLLLIDACHSGEIDKDDISLIDASTGDAGLKKGEKGLKPATTKTVGLQNSFQIMQNIFVNVGKSTGAVVISAATGTQFALERNDLKNGVFTYSILNALKSFDHMNISGLSNLVFEQVYTLTKGLQYPSSRGTNKIVDWQVW